MKYGNFNWRFVEHDKVHTHTKKILNVLLDQMSVKLWFEDGFVLYYEKGEKLKS